MKTQLSLVVLLVFALTALLVGAVSAQGPGLQGAPSMPSAASATGGFTADPQPRMAETLRSSPVMFIQNDGQFGEGARFQVRGGDRTFWLADDGLWITVLEKPASPLPERLSPTSPPEFGGADGGRSEAVDESLPPLPSGDGLGVRTKAFICV